MMDTHAPEVARLLARWNGLNEPRTVLREAADRFGTKLALAMSFSPEDTLLLHWAAALPMPPRVFALDTGRLPEATHELAAELKTRYGLAVEWYFPEAVEVEELLRRDGPYGFRDSLEQRRRCCAIRKVAPLGRALAGAAGWITGQRRDQAVTRGQLPVAEVDEAHGGILKLNPLAAWSSDQVWHEVRAARLPYNSLFDQGYKSIGCAPCTRAVGPEEDERAGRWWWEQPEHKECGLHPQPRTQPILKEPS